MEGELAVKLASGIISILGAIVTYVLVPYIKSKSTKEQMEQAYFWVSTGVAAAEQIYKRIPQSGEDKKKYVQGFLLSKGIRLSEDDLSVLIEAAVGELSTLERAWLQEPAGG